MNLSTARIFVRDLPQAESFYKGMLGLTLQAGGGSVGYCVFEAGDCQLVVESVGPEAPPEDQALVGRFTGLSFTVSDVAARYAELVGRGVEFSGAPETQPWGGVLATLLDPAGNALQLVQMPGA